jgi:hypothetical protein
VQGRVTDALGQGLFAAPQANQVAAQFDPATLGSLESCSFVLHRHRRERVLPAIDVNRIRDLLRELQEELWTSEEINSELRDFLLLHVRAMAQAVDDLTLICEGRSAVKSR